jgi:hypothetical protein
MSLSGPFALGVSGRGVFAAKYVLAGACSRSFFAFADSPRLGAKDGLGISFGACLTAAFTPYLLDGACFFKRRWYDPKSVFGLNDARAGDGASFFGCGSSFPYPADLIC